MFILSIILLVVAIMLNPRRFSDEFKKGVSSARRVLFTLSAIFLSISIVRSTYYSVPAGYRGILLQFGAVKGRTMDEGIHFVTPYVQSVQLVEVRTQKEETVASAASRDLQNVKTNVAINYHLNPETVGALFSKVGLDFAHRIIDPATQETVKSVIAKYTAEELVKMRSTVKDEIDSKLTERLAKYDIIVETNGVSLTNFEFSEEFNQAIESKQVAQQAAEKSKYELQKAEVDAKTAIARASGEAQANRIKANALNSLGGERVLAREWIEKWDGHLPMVQSGNGMMLNFSDLNKLKGNKE